MIACHMRSPVTVTTAMVSVEFMLYTLCLCGPRWMVLPEGTSIGLFAVCNIYEGFSSCILFPAWAVILCACALIAFLVSIGYHAPLIFRYLGWPFYICCATLFYASVSSVILGLVKGPIQIVPTNMGSSENQQMTP
ncbi:hypothetical protein DPEC_G00022510 [Dallia pectoralis]|uniref:Uncharacterized protein n=1 Tax=Dallia pectoralis TaxID=75939 RepID=A0ACC2HGE5_DALPE|nr:hypothetical protein DPEC_G00022510 [Dallia pectoralis]